MTAKKKESPKDKALELVLGAIQKTHGKEAIITGHDTVPGVEFFSSGCPSLDRALSGGKGWARGRMLEVFGPESSGKTTLCLHAIAQIQKLGGMAAFIDAEHALDPSYAAALGIDMESLLLAQPDTGEQALDITDMLVHSGALDLIVVDSIAALVPKAEIEGRVGDSHMGLQARLMGQAMRKMAGGAHRNSTSVLFINQIRMKIGVMFGSPETTPGGNALKFYASQRVDVRRIGGVKPEGADKDDPTIQFVGNRTRAKVIKNKVAPPFRQAEFTIRYGEGIDVAEDILDLAVTANVVEKAGSWYSYKGERLGQGKANITALLKENEKLFSELWEQVVGT